jgi:hypothetical protein
MKQPINEIERLKLIAGLINEVNYNDTVYGVNRKTTLTEAKQEKTLHIDVANPFSYRRGLQYELEQMDDYSDEALDKAKVKVLKNLAKDANFYFSLLNQQPTGFEFKAPETDAPGMQANADGTLKKGAGKLEKSNVKDSLSKSEAAKGKPKGVKEMPDKGIEGKEKTIKEGIDGGIIGKIKDFVGSKGFQFGVRRPSEEEDKIAVDHFSDYENKKVNSIGVDKITGNIYAANDDYEVVLSPKGKVLKSDTSITGKYNKDALDAYQGELEKDADKYYKRQDIKNKLKSLVGYKPDEFGDYRFEDKEKVVKEGLEEAKKSNEIEWISSDFSPIKGIKVKKGDKGEIVNHDTGNQYLVKFNNHRFYANAKDFKEGKEEMNEEFKYFDNYEEFENTLFQLYPQVKANPEKYKKERNGEVGYSDGYVNWGSWNPNRPNSPSGLPPGAVNMNNKLSYSDLIYPPGSRMDEDNMESNPANGDSSAEGQFNQLMSKYDWYHEMSDDPRKWDMGSTIDQKLKSLAKTIGVDRAVELFNDKAPSDRKVTTTFFAEGEDKHAKIKETLKKGLKELMSATDIQAAKLTGKPINVSKTNKQDITALQTAKANFTTYE